MSSVANTVFLKGITSVKDIFKERDFIHHKKDFTEIYMNQKTLIHGVFKL